MGFINVLDKHTADLIAAGEVVERPASAIKELMENSIDAGATEITVEIKNGGTSFIRITDNGCGIMREDVKKAFLSHATSKIRQSSDLDAISTLGFRGEALASIAAVSRVQLLTKHTSEPSGTSYILSGGEAEDFEEAGCPTGTTLIIRDLFYNVPARLKFLKKDVSEGNAVSNVVDKIALSHPEVKISYIKDGKQILKTAGDGRLESAVYSVYGREFSSGMLPVDYELNGVKVKGFISSPENSRANRNMQNFFINGRFVKSRTAGAAVDEAAKGCVMTQKFLACVLHISLPKEQLDVNVHPAKIEIRFVNERPIFDAVYHGVKSSLFVNTRKKQISFNQNAEFGVLEPPKNKTPFEVERNKFYNAQKPKHQQDSAPKIQPNYPPKLLDITNSIGQSSQESDTVQMSKSIVRDVKPQKEDIAAFLDLCEKIKCDEKPKLETEKSWHELKKTTPKPERATQEVTKSISEAEEAISNIEKISETSPAIFIGELFKTYILAEKENKLLLVDKHAAHERIIYEKLKKEHENLSSQMLLTPQTINLSKKEYDAALQNKEIFKKSGFEIDDFGNGVIIIRNIPQVLDQSEAMFAVEEICENLCNGSLSKNTEKIDWIFHNVACRAAIKAGNKTTAFELQSILKVIETDENVRYCPHGRPVCIELKKSEIEKYFGRM